MINKSTYIHLTVAALLLTLHGCASRSVTPLETNHQAKPTIDMFNGESQPPQNQNLLLTRKLEQLKREASLAVAQKEEADKLVKTRSIELQILNGQLPSREEKHASTFQSATHSAQQQIAASHSRLITETASLNSKLDVEIAELEAGLERQIASLKAKVELEKAKKRATTRLEIAKASVKAEAERANVLSPVLTSNGVITHLPSAPSSSNAKPRVSRKTGVVAPIKTRTVFDVVYMYRDKRSWRRFNKLLRGYGIKDMAPVLDRKNGYYYTYVGRYHTIEKAIKRKLYLNKKTFTDHAEIRSTTVKL